MIGRPAGIGTYAWALQHWFVGVEGSGQDEHVAVFRGLHTSPFGVDLYRADSSTDLAVSDLTPDYRSRVRDGIEATDADDAARILATLRAHRLPPCRTTGKAGPASTDYDLACPPGRPCGRRLLVVNDRDGHVVKAGAKGGVVCRASGSPS